MSGIKMGSVGLMATNWFYRNRKITTVPLKKGIINDATNSLNYNQEVSMIRIGKAIGGPKDEPFWYDRENFISQELPLASYPEEDKLLANVFCRCGSTKYVDSNGLCAYCYLKWGRQLEEYDEKGLSLFRAG